MERRTFLAAFAVGLVAPWKDLIPKPTPVAVEPTIHFLDFQYDYNRMWCAQERLMHQEFVAAMGLPERLVAVQSMTVPKMSEENARAFAESYARVTMIPLRAHWSMDLAKPPSSV